MLQGVPKAPEKLRCPDQKGRRRHPGEQVNHIKYEPMNFPFKNPEEYGDVPTITNIAGIELRDENGKERIPYHCNEKMQVKRGIIGPDYARCNTCELVICNMLSPHINGGMILKEEVIRTYGESLWTMRKTNKEEETG